MTGLAPISDAAAVGANSAVAANSGTTSTVQSAGSQRPADFSSVLNATSNAPQTAPGETPGKNVVIALSTSSRPQKTSTAQANSLGPVAQARVTVSAAAPVAVLSALSAAASSPVPPPVPPATAASLEPAAAASESSAAASAAIAAQAVASASVQAHAADRADATQRAAISLVDAAASKIVGAALPATTVAADDSAAAQTVLTQTGPPNGNANGNADGDLSAAQSATSVDQDAALQSGTEVAATISSAVALSAAGNRAPGDASQVAAARADSAQANAGQSDSASLAVAASMASGAKPAATPQPVPKVEPPLTVLPAQFPALPKQNPAQPLPRAATTAAPSVRGGPNSRPISQAIAPETVAANSTAANASLQKAISDARDKLVQAIDADLQAEISAAPSKAIASADPASGEGGNPVGQNPANSSFNSGAQDLLKQYGDAATGVATNASGISSELDALSANNAPSAVAKAAALVATAADPAVRVLPDASQQAANAATAPTVAQAVSTTTTSTSAARPEPAPPSPLPQTLPQSLNDVAKAGELYQRVGGSEMHIAMETDLLGSVDLRATMHQSALSATIGVTRADVQALLANELPALQHALADKNFHVEQISVLNNSVGGRAGSGGEQQAPAQNQHPFAPRGGFPANATGAGAAGASSHAEDMRAIAGASTMSTAARAWSDDGGRISVHV
jgi:hypothetical protein